MMVVLPLTAPVLVENASPAGSAGLMLATLGPGLMQRHAVPLRYRRLRSVEKSIVSPDYRGLSRVFFGRNSPER